MQNVNLNKCSTNIIENRNSQDHAKYDVIDDEVITLQQQVC